MHSPWPGPQPEPPGPHHHPGPETSPALANPRPFSTPFPPLRASPFPCQLLLISYLSAQASAPQRSLPPHLPSSWVQFRVHRTLLLFSVCARAPPCPAGNLEGCCDLHGHVWSGAGLTRGRPEAVKDGVCYMPPWHRPLSPAFPTQSGQGHACGPPGRTVSGLGTLERRRAVGGTDARHPAWSMQAVQQARLLGGGAHSSLPLQLLAHKRSPPRGPWASGCSCFRKGKLWLRKGPSAVAEDTSWRPCGDPTALAALQGPVHPLGSPGPESHLATARPSGGPGQPPTEARDADPEPGHLLTLLSTLGSAS